MDHQAEAHLPHAKGTPLVPVSGVTRKNLDKLMDACLKVHKDWSARDEDARSQRLAALRDAEASAAGAERQAHQAALHGADENPPAHLRADVLSRANDDAGDRTSAIC